MQLGKTLVGAIIGAALGIGLLIVTYLFFGLDKVWMAIPVAVLTGLGVRLIAAKGTNASYLRGAITVVLALGAYLGGLAITRSVANHRAESVAKANPPRVAAADEAPDAGDAKTEEPAVAPPVVAPPIAPTRTDSALRRPAMPQQFSKLDFISLAVAALLAYELGRGSDAKSKNLAGSEPSEPAMAGTHPDA